MTNLENIIYDLKQYNFIFSRLEYKLAKFKCNYYYLKIKQAPEPSDILWMNIGIQHKKINYRATSNIVIYSLVFILFLVLLSIKKIIKSEQKS